jgi:glycosyltransferase involved in cell wall biosynthesis
VLEIVVDARSVIARASGIGNYTEALVRHMVPLADDMRFLVLRHPEAQEPIVADDRVEELRCPGETKSMATVLRLGRVRHGFRGYDLYHSPGDLVPLGLRCPSVVTVHDLMWVEAPRLASAFLPVRFANGLWYRLTSAQAVRGARAVIAISQATADAIGRVYPRQAHKVKVIHHGLDHARYAADRAGPRSLLDGYLPRDCRYSLIVGQGSPYKNHLGMVRAFIAATADQPDHKLVLVRRFSRVDLAFRRLLSRPEVRDKVVVLPFVSDEALLALYRHARIVLCASHYEGFGMPALEAMSLGAVVLGSTAAAVREITAHGTLHADPSSVDDMACKIRRLDDDESLRSQLVAAGRERASEFSWDRCAQATLDVYRAAVQGG